MTRAVVAETHPSFDWSSEGLSIFRNIISEELDVIFGRLAILSAGAEGIVLPINPGREVSPVTELVKTKEIQANNGVLQIDKHNIQNVRMELCDELPELTEPRTAVIQQFEVHTNKQGNHYLSFLFSEKSGYDLSQERTDIWEVLHDIRGIGRKKLHWRPYCPDVRVARINQGIPGSVVSHIGRYITKKLEHPLEVSLASVPESSPIPAVQTQHIAA